MSRFESVRFGSGRCVVVLTLTKTRVNPTLNLFPLDLCRSHNTAVRPEDLDSLLQQMDALVRDEQQWARLASACVGAALGLAVFPSHDFFGVVAGAPLYMRVFHVQPANP